MSYSLQLYAVDLEALREALGDRPEFEALRPSSAADERTLSDTWYAVERLDLVREGHVALSTWSGVRVASNRRIEVGVDVLHHLVRSRPPFGTRPADRFPVVGHLTRDEVAEHADALAAKVAELDDGSGDEETRAVIELAEAVIAARDAPADMLSFFY